MVVEKPTGERVCENPDCLKRYVRDVKKESPSKFEERKFCCVDCAKYVRAANTRLATPDKVCAYSKCGKTFSRNPKISPTSFARQKCCSIQCGIDHRWEKHPSRVQKAKPKGPMKMVKRVKPPTPSTAREIPPAPPSSEPVTIWRPESWGGPYVVEVAQTG